MRVVILLFIIFIPSVADAFSFDSSIINLKCPGRGTIEIILHRYEHTQESWGEGNFETGSGYSHEGALFIFDFANQDKMIYNRAENSFAFWYESSRKLVNCNLITLKSTYPVNLPYVHG
ncbi:hypothetical protein F6T13_03420 [Escherichia coli]|nr:hypothetical protein [Escherichia coli]EFD4959007.1 hypothetical protein [Escherichia coli]EGF7409579.1 hypothetical protein [Escherichia coli]EGF7450706.1 hypothetical protein [Escherichia coli]